jgi:hypothetical protein
MNKVRCRPQARYDDRPVAERTAMSKLRTALTLMLLAALLACGPPTRADLLKKTASVKTKTELEQALGKPADIAKLGPLEKWTYKTAGGAVIFVIAGETVTTVIIQTSAAG